MSVRYFTVNHGKLVIKWRCNGFLLFFRVPQSQIPYILGVHNFNLIGTKQTHILYPPIAMLHSFFPLPISIYPRLHHTSRKRGFKNLFSHISELLCDRMFASDWYTERISKCIQMELIVWTAMNWNRLTFQRLK